MEIEDACKEGRRFGIVKVCNRIQMLRDVFFAGVGLCRYPNSKGCFEKHPPCRPLTAYQGSGTLTPHTVEWPYSQYGPGPLPPIHFRADMNAYVYTS